MKGIEVDVPYEEKASRLELIWRIGYGIAYMLIGMFFSMIASLCWMIQILVVLILGKRIEILNKVMHAYIKWAVPFMAYFYIVTDERPEIMPKM